MMTFVPLSISLSNIDTTPNRYVQCDRAPLSEGDGIASETFCHKKYTPQSFTL